MTEQDRGGKYGPRLDDAVKQRTEPLERGGHESHVEEWKEEEPSGEQEPVASLAPGQEWRMGTPPGLAPEDVEGRSELARFVQPSVFPAPASALVESAQETAAPDHVVALLRALPPERVYQNVQEIWRDLSGGTEDASRRP